MFQCINNLKNKPQLDMKVLLSLVFLVGATCAQLHEYVNKASDQIDSSEHGAGPGRVKTNCPCGWANRVNQRVVGGKETGVNQFPWLVALTPSDRLRLYCGGSLITPIHVLTAAHCLINKTASGLSVVVGEHSTTVTWDTDATEVIQVAEIINHEKYSTVDHINDIAILVLKKPATFSQKVGPACLPKSKNQFNLFEKYVKVMGWGHVRPNFMMSSRPSHTNLRVIPISICKSLYRFNIPLNPSTQICTYSKKRDSCQGDSGGPLLYLDESTNRYTQVALVSYGSVCASEKPGVNTDVAAYLPWIQSVISKTRSILPTAQTCQSL